MLNFVWDALLTKLALLNHLIFLISIETRTAYDLIIIAHLLHKFLMNNNNWSVAEIVLGMGPKSRLNRLSA